VPDSTSVHVGVSLSSGGAAGLAHIGALEELASAGVPIRSVAGTSAGALVGAAFANGKLAEFREALSTLTRRRVLRLFDPVWPRSGLLEGRRLEQFFAPFLGERIEDLTLAFAAVATDLRAGGEVVLRDGPVLDAVRASAAVPGVFTPKLHEGRPLADGGLINPLPIDVARAMGADFVIAVSVLPLPDGDRALLGPRSFWRELRTSIGARLAVRAAIRAADGDEHEASESAGAVPPVEEDLRLIQVLYRASSMVQSQIVRSRLAIDPPNALVCISVPDLGLFDLHRASELIEVGREAMRAALPEIHAALAARAPFHRRMSRWFETRRAS
jgi:NTE family protein